MQVKKLGRYFGSGCGEHQCGKDVFDEWVKRLKAKGST